MNDVNEEMMMAAALGIASCVKEEELKEDYILPFAFDMRAHEMVAKCVKEAAIKSGAIRK